MSGARRRRRDRPGGHRPGVRAAPHDRREATGARAAHRGRRHQHQARRPAAARRARPPLGRARHRDRLRRPPGGVQGAKRGPNRPADARARDRSSAPHDAPQREAPPQGAVRSGGDDLLGRRDRRDRRRPDADLERPPRRARAVRHHRRHPRLRPGASRPVAPARLRHRRHAHRPPRRTQGGVPRRPGRQGTSRRRGARHRDGHGGGRHRPVHPRQPREQTRRGRWPARKVKVSSRTGRVVGPARSARPPDFRDKVAAFIDGLVSHYVLDGGRLVVAHAGLP